MKLFIMAAEPSADLHGSLLVQELLKLKPNLQIYAVAGPRLRALPIHIVGKMEDLEVMGFIDVLLALPKLIYRFFSLRRKILQLNPNVALFIDYPGFNLRMQRTLRKKGYSSKLIHYVCPTVWAWGKSWIPVMASQLDLLLTLFPFEPACFAHTSLPVRFVGNPVVTSLKNYTYTWKPTSNLIGIFPGSRTKEIIRNLPIQLEAAKILQRTHPHLSFAISLAHQKDESLIRSLLKDLPFSVIPPEDNYNLMKHCTFAIATSGTVTLELALHHIPTVVTFAIKRVDQFIAQKIFKINLPHYCIVNILAQKEVFPELFGTNLTLPALLTHINNFLNEGAREECRNSCQSIQNLLTDANPAETAAKQILQFLNISPL